MPTLRWGRPIWLGIVVFIVVAMLGFVGFLNPDGSADTTRRHSPELYLQLLNPCIIAVGVVGLIATWTQAEAAWAQQRDQRFALAMNLLGSWRPGSDGPNLEARMGAVAALLSLAKDQQCPFKL